MSDLHDSKLRRVYGYNGTGASIMVLVLLSRIDRSSLFFAGSFPLASSYLGADSLAPVHRRAVSP